MKRAIAVWLLCASATAFAGTGAFCESATKIAAHHTTMTSLVSQELARHDDGELRPGREVLVDLLRGFSAQDISDSSLWPPAGSAEEDMVELMAALVQRGDLVSVQMLQLTSPEEWRQSLPGRMVHRLLETAYAPFEGLQGLQSGFMPQWVKDLPDEDLQFNLELAQARQRLLQMAEAVGQDFSLQPVRWYLQSIVYNDAVARAVNRDILCSDTGFASAVATLEAQTSLWSEK